MKIYKDICVLGSQLPALIAASHLQRKGARIHFLDHAKHSQFDPAIGEFLSGVFVKPLLQRLGFHPVDIQKLFPLDVPMQLICESKRVNFYKDLKKLQKELEREKINPKVFSVLEKLDHKPCPVLQKIYQREFRMFETNSIFKKSLEKQIKEQNLLEALKNIPMEQMMLRMDIAPEYKHFVKSLELTYSYFLSQDLNRSRLIHMLHLLQEDGYYSLLGLQGLKQKLKKQLQEKGAVFETFEGIEKIHRSGSKITGLTLQGTSNPQFEFANLLIAGNPHGLVAYQDQDKKLKGLVQNDQFKCIGRKMVFLFKIHRSLLPYGMKTQGIIFPNSVEIGQGEKRKIPRILRYMLHMPNSKANNYKSQVDALENDYVLLAVTYYVSFDTDVGVRKIQEEIFTTLQQLIPFLTIDNVTLMQSYLPVVESQAGDFRQGFVYGPSKSTMTDFEGTPIQTDFKNVWLANESHFPSLGLDGEIIAGDQLALSLS